jgi:hypothetical protein
VAPPDDAGVPACPAIAFARQRDDLLLQNLSHGLEAQRNEGLDQRHLALDLLGPWHGGQDPTPDLFQLALFAHPEYSFHRSGSFLLVWVVVVSATITAPHRSRFVNFQLTMAHLLIGR